MTTEVLRIEKKINAEPTRLFRAWLKAEEFSRWFLSGDLVGIESVKMDPRPGGRFQINMILNGQILPHVGEYLVIEEPTKLVFTWRSHATKNLDTLVTVIFTALLEVTGKGSKNTIHKPQTLVTLIHERLESGTEIEMHHYGWTNILIGLEKWHSEEE
ncbi:SRPBCC domain-containing protein [Leptospira sp. WS92.C1]